MQEPLHGTSNYPGMSLVTDKLGLSVLLYAYAMLVGAAYIFSYWRVFGLDVFPYTSSFDYISTPLNRLLVFLSAPLLCSIILFSQSDRADPKFLNKILLYVIGLYMMFFAKDYYQAVSRFIVSDFHYENEKSVLMLGAFLFAAALAFTYRAFKLENNILTCATALIFIQLAGTVSAGYSDGKAIFNGAKNVFFLDSKELCEPGGVRDWVYLGKLSDKAFFMNTIDKRLCLTNASSFKLTPRKFSEGL